jgi:hypothetical protein
MAQLKGERVKSPRIPSWIDERGARAHCSHVIGGKTQAAAQWIAAHIGQEFRACDIGRIIGKKGRDVDDVLANFEHADWPFLVYQEGTGLEQRLTAMWKPGREGEVV